MPTVIEVLKQDRIDTGFDFERRPDIAGWDFTLYLGRFHVIISHTSGRVS